MKAASAFLDDASVGLVSDVAQRRVLVAVSDFECRYFKPTIPSGRTGMDYRRYDTTVRDSELWRDYLKEFAPEVLVSCWSTPALPEEWLAAPECPLKYVSHITGSVRKVVPRSFLERGGVVSNWGAIAAPMVAEHALLLGLAALRNLSLWRPLIAQPTKGRRSEQLETRSLYGRNVGLHGFGQVARALTELLKPFGVTIRAYSAGVPNEFVRAHGVLPCHSLNELFSSSDILFECEALTERSRSSVNAEALACLRDDAVFVNVGRGLVVDEEALIREASSGRLRVALDVVAHEPLSSASTLARIPGVLLSPHIAGPTVDRYPDCAALALANVERYLCGEPVQAQLTLAVFDRST